MASSRRLCATITALILSLPCAWPQRPETPEGGAHLDPARALLRAGDFYEAVRVLRRMEAGRPRDADIAMLLAHAYWLAGQKKLFVQKANRALELAPTSPAPSYALGRHYLDDLGRADLASRQFERALKLDPAHAASRYHAGWIHETEGRTGQALAEYTLAAKSGYWLAAVGLARLALARDDLDEALSQARAGVAAGAQWPMAHAMLARVLEQAGDMRAAIASYWRASELDPTDAALLYRLSRCAQAAGEADVAAEALRRHRAVRAAYSSR